MVVFILERIKKNKILFSFFLKERLLSIFVLLNNAIHNIEELLKLQKVTI